VQTVQSGMQPSTPPGQFSRRVNGHGVLTIPVDGDHSKQFDGQLSLPAANTRPNWAVRAFMR